jgi:hypothetical protein
MNKKWVNLIKVNTLDAPQPQFSPKVMVPNESSDTLNPLLPKSLYLMNIFSLMKKL